VREGRVPPIVAAVATVAFATVAAGMLVVVLVAVITSSAKLDAIELARMAGIAMNGGMGACQFEISIPVMVKDQLFPFLFVVALLAFVAITA